MRVVDVSSHGKPRDPLTGTPYRTERCIGRGASGEVFEATHVQLGKPVVVKVLRAALADSQTAVDRLWVEGQIAARIRHPNLTEVLDAGWAAEGRPYVVMERLQGRTLRDELRERGHLPPKEALGLVRQLLAGLAAVHRMGIVHRDIKLDNLFVSDLGDGQRGLKILDFGIAKVLPSAPSHVPIGLQTAAGVALGTPRYLAPEQALGDAVDGRADLYATGIVLYTLLCGRDPFEHWREVQDLLFAHVSEAPRPPSQVAPEPLHPMLDAILLKALSKRAEDRFASAEEFAEALEGVGDGAPPRWNETVRMEPSELARIVNDDRSSNSVLPNDRPPPSIPSNAEPVTITKVGGVPLQWALVLVVVTGLVVAAITAVVARLVL